MRWQLAFLSLHCAFSEYFPNVDPKTTWQSPLLQPWDPLRAARKSVMVTWTPAWNPWCAVGHYELQMRRPAGHPLNFHDMQRLQNREMDPEDESWPGDDAWTDWSASFIGPGRAYAQRVQPGGPPAVQFRVRACGTRPISDGCSDWSAPQTAHSVFSAPQDKVNIYIRGTGKNAPDYNEIVVNEHTIYRRRDETGLVVAIFSRLDFSLQWLQTYDTHRDRAQSVKMAKDVRQFNQSYFLMIVSSIAWEWRASRTLAKTLEYCGAYHFGQWAYVFAEQKHYSSPRSDLQQSASDAEFGHPFAFIGIPGIGSGMGWESLMYNTGHYESRSLHAQHAVIRAVAYYDYVARVFRLQDVVVAKADLYLRNSPPSTETVHNPYPDGTLIDSGHNIIDMQLKYKPYIGTMQRHITDVIEANESIAPYNYVFLLRTYANVFKVDPRPSTYKKTEIERLWRDASARYWPNGSAFMPGVHFSERHCTDFVFHEHLEASPEACGENFTACCPYVDEPGFIAAECNVGVAPTLCRNISAIQLENESSLEPKWPDGVQRPFGFSVINWTS